MYLQSILLLSLALGAPIDQDPRVATTYGTIQGQHIQNHRVRKFMGIPFAEPPVSNLRFQSPQPRRKWSQTLITKNEKPACYQLDISLMSEDCLYLNIWTPSVERIRKSDKPLPVLLFIFGGAFIFGGGNQHGLYDGARIVAGNDVILVTINHRVGPFGFLAVGNATGNYGIEDQRMAMQFVKENIHKFGGDSESITLMGISSGAYSVAVHLTSPLSAGLFNKAMIISGPWPILARTIQEANSYSMELATNVGCGYSNDVLECLRKVSATKLMLNSKWLDFNLDAHRRVLEVLVWTPVIDGKNIIDNPLRLIQNGKFLNVPLIIGTTEDEMHGFDALSLLFEAVYPFRKKTLTLNYYTELVTRIFGNSTQRVLDHYPATESYETNYQKLLKMGTDYVFACPSKKVANEFSARGNKVYSYLFSYIPDYIKIGPCSKRACHGAEMPLIFNNVLNPILLRVNALYEWFVDLLPFSVHSYFFSPSDNFIHHFMADRIIGFANDDINENGFNFNWPEFNGTNEKYMKIMAPPHVESHYKKHICDFWDSMGYDF